MSLALSTGPSPAFASPTLARVVHGRLLSYAVTTHEGYGGVVAYASSVSTRELAQFGPPNPASVSRKGARCFALGTVDAFQYPLISSDRGRSWRNAGHWFAGPWADGAAFANTVTTFSATTAAARYPGQNSFYVTSDARRHWYSAWLSGEVTSVASSNHGATMFVDVRNPPAVQRYEYRSTDGGRQWILIS